MYSDTYNNCIIIIMFTHFYDLKYLDMHNYVFIKILIYRKCICPLRLYLNTYIFYIPLAF